MHQMYPFERFMGCSWSGSSGRLHHRWDWNRGGHWFLRWLHGSQTNWGACILPWGKAIGERNIRREDDPCEGSSFIHRRPFHSSSAFYCSDPIYRNAQEHATHKTPKQAQVFLSRKSTKITLAIGYINTSCRWIQIVLSWKRWLTGAIDDNSDIPRIRHK